MAYNFKGRTMITHPSLNLIESNTTVGAVSLHLKINTLLIGSKNETNYNPKTKI